MVGLYEKAPEKAELQIKSAAGIYKKTLHHYRVYVGQKYLKYHKFCFLDDMNI